MDPLVGSAMIGLAGTGTNAMMNVIGAKKQHRRTKELMGLQKSNQMELNQQGYDLAYKMWNETNYKAQREQLKRAGLNPALMYGMGGGAGGTTQSGSGGSAASGQAPQNEFASMDIARSMSNVANAVLQAAKAKTEDESREPIVKGLQNESSLKREQARKIFIENTIQNYVAGGRKGPVSTRSASLDYGIALDENSPQVKKLKNESDKIASEIAKIDVEKIAAEKGIELTKEQTRKIYHDIITDYIKSGVMALNAVNIGSILQKAIKGGTNSK